MAVTVNYAWEIPTVGASLNTWGGILNTTLLAVDAQMAANAAATQPIARGGTGATSAAAALTALGGQPVDAALTAMSALNFVADRIAYSTGIDTFALAAFTAAGRALLDDIDAATQRATLGLTIGSNVQAYNANLAALAAIVGTRGDIIYHNGTAWVRRAVGTAGQVLGTDGTDVVWGSANSGVLTQYYRTPSALSIGALTEHTVTHNFGTRPKHVNVTLECLVSNSGFTAGQIIGADSGINAAFEVARGHALTLGTNTVIVNMGGVAGYDFIRRDTGAVNAAVSPNWGLHLELFA